MSLVGEQERKNLAAVGASRAAAMLGSVAYGQQPAEPSRDMPGPQLQGTPIPPDHGERLKCIDVSSGQRGNQIRTEKVANMADKGHRYTTNSVRKTESYLSYVLHKEGIGKIRVLHTPMVCKALVSHEAAVVDHSLKMTRLRKSDSVSGAVVASLDISGLLIIAAFTAPPLRDASEQYQKLATRTTLKLNFDEEWMPDPETKAGLGQPIGLVEIGAGYVYVALKTCLLCFDVEVLLSGNSTPSVPVQIEGARSGHALPSVRPLGKFDDSRRAGVQQLVSTRGDITALAVHPCGHEVAVGDASGAVHVVPAAAPLPAAVFEASCDGDTAQSTSDPLPVNHLSYLACAPVADDVTLGKTALVSAVVDASGSLQLSTWGVNLSEGKMPDEDMPQVLPVDTLCLHASASAGGGEWIVRVHPDGWGHSPGAGGGSSAVEVSGAILAAQSGDEFGEIHVITATLRTELVHWVRCSVGAQLFDFGLQSAGEITDKPPSEVTEGIQSALGGDAPVSLVLRLSDGVAKATIPCMPLTPQLPTAALGDGTPEDMHDDDVAVPETQPEESPPTAPPAPVDSLCTGGSFCSASSADVDAVQAALEASADAPEATAPEATVAAAGHEREASGDAPAAPPVATTHPEHVTQRGSEVAHWVAAGHTAAPQVAPSASTPQETQQAAAAAAESAAPVATATAVVEQLTEPAAQASSGLLSSLLQQAGAAPAAAPAPVATAVAGAAPVAAPAGGEEQDGGDPQDWGFHSGPVRPSQRGFNEPDGPPQAPQSGATQPPPDAAVAASAAADLQSLEPPVPDPGPPDAMHVAAATFPAVAPSAPDTGAAAAAAAAAAPPVTVSASLLPQDLFGSSSVQLGAAVVEAEADTLPPALRSEGSLVEALLSASAQQQPACTAPSATQNTTTATVPGGCGALPHVATPDGSVNGGSTKDADLSLKLNRGDRGAAQHRAAGGGSMAATPNGGAAAESPVRGAGDNGAPPVSNKALKGLDARVRDGTNIVKGLQSTVQKLQNELERSNAEVAKANRAQAATERVVRSIEGSLEKLPVVVEAAVAQGLQAALPAAVRAQVGGVVVESFRAAFTGSIVPAFEQAMHAMFKQVDEAVSQGLAEHLATARAMHEPLAQTSHMHGLHTTSRALEVPFGAPSSLPPQHLRQQHLPPSSAPVTTAAVAAGTFAQPASQAYHMHGAPMTSVAMQSASISSIIDSERAQAGAMHTHGARAFQAGPANGAGQPPSTGVARADADASDPARWGQPRDLQPFSMGGGSAVAGLEGASGSIEGLGVAVQGQGGGSQGGSRHHSHSQSQGHAPPGFPLRPQQQRQKQQPPPFQAATAGVLSGVAPAPAPAPVSAASSQVSPAHRSPSDSLSNDRESALKELTDKIARQDLAGVRGICMRNPPATALHLSPLHSACVVDVLCPALEALAGSQDAGTESHVVQLLEWMKECMGNLELAPDNQSQSNVIRQIIQKSQTAVRGVMDHSTSGEVRRICVPLGKLLAKKLAAFP